MTTLASSSAAPAANSAGRGPARPSERNPERAALADVRLPPQNLDAEMNVLGSMMLSRDAIGAVLPIINRSDVEWFYRPDHRQLFEALVDLYDSNVPIDLTTVVDELQRRDLLEAVGGVDRIVTIVESIPSWLNAERYAHIVREKGLLRELIRAAGQISDDAYADRSSAAEILDRAEQALFQVTERRVSGQALLLRDIIPAVAEQIRTGEGHFLTGLPTGFTELDDLTSGLQRGDFIVIAGRPSMGKTAFGLNVAESMAISDRHPVVFFSMEMSKEQVVQRLLCSRARVDSHRFRKRILGEADVNRLLNLCGELEEAPLFVDDTPGMTALELRAKARRLKMQHNIQAVFVDYLQLMHIPGAENRQQEISTISRGLKSLGRELGIPIVAMAQLNRQTEGREGHRPRMSDLRESGAIEQDADVVMLIHREEYYKKDDPSVKNMAEIIVAKQRNGPTHTVKLVFNHQLTRFDNWSPVPDPGYVTNYSGDSPF